MMKAVLSTQYPAMRSGCFGWVLSTGYWSQLLRQQRQSRNVPRKMMHRVCSRQNHASSRSKSQSHQSVTCNFQAGFAIWRNLHDAALSGERGRNVQIACGVKSQPLRTSQAAEERVHGPLRINLVDAIKARRGRPGHKQVALRTERKMVSRHTRLQSRKYKHLLI